MDLTKLTLACGVAFAASAALTPFVRNAFRSANVVDHPGHRKLHSIPIPRVGGIPIAVAYFFSLGLLDGPNSVFPTKWLQAFLLGALVIFLVGLCDDFFNLRARVKLVCQVPAALAAFAAGVRIDHLGTHPLPLWISLPATVVWLLLTTNAMNLIDGLDGLCGGLGIWAAASFFAVSALQGNTTLAFVSLPLAFALLGFLIYNFNPASVFLGDSGALLVGFLLGCFGILWTGHRLTLTTGLFPVLALLIPLADVGLSISRRLLKRQGIFTADRGHIHHRLLDAGWKVRQIAVFIYALAILGGLAGIVIDFPGGNSQIKGLTLAIVLIGIVVGIKKLRYPEFEVAARLLFQGEFQKVFADRLRLEQLAQELESCVSSEEWWHLLVVACRDWGWIRVTWTSPSGARKETLASRTPAWSFLIELSGDLSGKGSVLLEGDNHSSGNPAPDMIALSSVLRRTSKRGSMQILKTVARS